MLVIPDKMSREKVFHLQALGAEVVMTRSDVGRGHPQYYQDLAERITRETPGAFYVNQFNNPANPLAHETTTGPEIWEQTEHKLDAVVCGVGSGGTHHRAEPLLCPRRAARRNGAGRSGRLGPGRIRADGHDRRGGLVGGRGDRRGFRSADRRPVARPPGLYASRDAESLTTARELLRREGILAGSSSGTLVAAALRYCREQTRPKTRRHVRLRLGQQVSVEDVQRLLDGRPGLSRRRAASATCAT